MAHLAPNSAIFSPSVARAAASTAKDWNYINSWLSVKFHGRTPPAFERNSDTLRALLALASANETADEERDLVARVEASALQEVENCHQAPSAAVESERGDGCASGLDEARATICAAVEEGLPREGQVALDTIASSGVALGLGYADPEAVGCRMVALQAQLYDLERSASRVSALQLFIKGECDRTGTYLDKLQGDESCRPAPELAKLNLETLRRVKATAAKLPDLRDKLAVLAAHVGTPNPTIDQVRKEEEAYLQLLAQKRELDGQVRSFQGLPTSTEEARKKLEDLRLELRQATRHRDAIFEGLVERETPRKAR